MNKKQYIYNFFKKHPNKVIQLKEIDSAVKEDYFADNGSYDIYVNRLPRQLVKMGYIDELGGFIERPSSGKFKFVKGKKKKIPKSPFSSKVKKTIKIRDGYKCQMCGVPETTKNILAIDHIIPEDSGGKGVLNNGITLCITCNNLKKNLNVTTFGKNLFKKYLALSIANKDIKTVSFLKELLQVYDKHKFN
jgi:hypothetical protein